MPRIRTPADAIRIGEDVVAYLSHALGSSNGSDAIKHHDNIANSGRWLHFLVEATPWIVMMPWYPYVSLGIQRERGFVDQLRFVKRCDALILCGGKISPHMKYEIEWAQRGNVAIVDLTDLGVSPPIEEDPSFYSDMLEDRLIAAGELLETVT